MSIPLTAGSSAISLPPESPLETLKRRLAKGEISSSEYEEKRRLLS
jgi:hypothetical protein